MCYARFLESVHVLANLSFVLNVSQVFSLHYDIKNLTFLDDADIEQARFETSYFVFAKSVLAHALIGTSA